MSRLQFQLCNSLNKNKNIMQKFSQLLLNLNSSLRISFLKNKKSLSHEKLGFLNFLFSFFDEKKYYYINFLVLNCTINFSQSNPGKTSISFSSNQLLEKVPVIFLLFTIRENFWPKYKRVWKNQKRKIKSKENSSFFFSLRKIFFTKHTQLRPNNSHENVKSEWGKIWRKFCVRIFSLMGGWSLGRAFNFSSLPLTPNSLLMKHKQVLWQRKN